MEWVAQLGAVLVSAGPIGAVVASVLVGLALIVIIFAQVSGVFAQRRATVQNTDFQASLLKAVQALTDSEAALRRENAEQREVIERLQASVSLLREQGRRTIDLLHRVMDGSLLPTAISPDDLPAERG